MLRQVFILNLFTIGFAFSEQKYLIVKTVTSDNATQPNQPNISESGLDYSLSTEELIVFSKRVYNSEQRFWLVEETALERNKMLTTLPIMAKLFKISFDVWLSPSIRDVWQSVIHFTNGGDLPRLPAIFIGNGNKCLVQFQDIAYRCDNVLGQTMMNRWMFIELEQKMMYHGKREWQIKFDKEVLFAQENPNPKDHRSVKVFAGNDWYPVANGKIRNLIVSPKTNKPIKLGYYGSSWGHIPDLVLKQGRKNNILPYLAREFSISFNFWLDSTGNDVWQSVLHFAQGGDNPNDVRDYPRIPAVFIGEGNKLTILMQNLRYDAKTPLPTKKYTNIEMSQKFEKGSRNKYIFELKINKQKVFSMENKFASIFPWISVFVGDPWFPPAKGHIRDLKFFQEH